MIVQIEITGVEQLTFLLDFFDYLSKDKKYERFMPEIETLRDPLLELDSKRKTKEFRGVKKYYGSKSK